MGKTGARELNYVSDVDVIFVAGADEAASESLGESRVVDIATRLAVQTMRGITSIEIEPPLWEVDANLRPEGKQGALVRTLDSHLSYYDRWAKSWEFQALLKARPIAGDAALGDAYVRAVQPKIWTSAARENFVDSVQRMRERVTEHIPAADVPYQLKLGPGGIRDIEFTVQLLQLVHGLSDERIRQRGTLDALDALVAEGYIGRAEAAAFSRDYRVLRLLEHRVQLRNLRRTHLMPSRPEDLRVLARSSGLADTGERVWSEWESVKREVRDIHVRLFYRPLLSAVAALPAEERALSPEQAHDRLAAIGFADPAGALRHIAALTSGLSRKATIQRHLMPVMIRWFADGVDPDYGLLDLPPAERAARRHALVPADAARLVGRGREPHARALGLALRRRAHGVDPRVGGLARRSRGAAPAIGCRAPGGGARDPDPPRHDRGRHALGARAPPPRAAAHRDGRDHRHDDDRGGRRRAHDDHRGHDPGDAACGAPRRRSARGRRPRLLGHRHGPLRRRRARVRIGRRRHVRLPAERRRPAARPRAGHCRSSPRCASTPKTIACRSTSTPTCAPRAATGRIARSLDSYAEYYRRWSLSWEAQALLRARGVAGSVKLIRAFTELADDVRYPASVDPQGLREIKRIKARVENERLPQGADPARHLKLGPGSLSDVEWLVQLLQLEHAHAVPGMRTTSTIDALRAAAEAGLVPAERRRSARRGVAAREPAALGEHAALGADERRAPERPQAPRRHRPAARVPAAVGDAGRGGLPRRDASLAPGVREALLRLRAVDRRSTPSSGATLSRTVRRAQTCDKLSGNHTLILDWRARGSPECAAPTHFNDRWELSVWLAVGSFLLVFVLMNVWGLFILLPQWKLVGGEPDPAYIAQSNVGTALFAGTSLVLAIAAVYFGARSIDGAKPAPPGETGKKAAIVCGGIGADASASCCSRQHHGVELHLVSASIEGGPTTPVSGSSPSCRWLADDRSADAITPPIR